MKTIYNPEFNNKIQKESIENVLNGLLKDNEILLKNEIYSFLSGKCDHCSEEIINPRIINTIHVCEKCINNYIYCCKDKCKNVIINPNYNERCNSCLAWYCDNHQEDKNHCCDSRIKKFVFKHFKKYSSGRMTLTFDIEGVKN